MVTTEKSIPTTLPPVHSGDAALGLPSCVFCGRSMATLDTGAGAPIHPDCFTNMCVATLVEETPRWRWIPYLGWTFR